MSEKKPDSIKYHRIRTVLLWLAALLTAGLLYALFITVTGISLPCVFHETTGLWCPGCGVSRMFLKLIKGDFYGAFLQNRFLFSTLIFLLSASAFRIYQYIRKEPYSKTKWFVVFIIVYGSAFFIYGVLRNLSAFSFLAPI